MADSSRPGQAVVRQRQVLADPVRFGHYWLLERLGTGGMAEVFRAVPDDEPDLDAAVALKCVRTDLQDHREFIHMFVDEGRIATRLQHPSLGSVIELGCEENRYFQAMPYLPGVDVFDLLRVRDGAGRRRRRLLDASVAAHIAKRVAEGLAHAHQLRDEYGQPLQLVHRDVNPSNIRVTLDGRVVLLDFGVACTRERLTRTQRGKIKGKLSYISPEQLRRDGMVDGRADIFALGVTLYEMITGIHPFADRDVRVMFKNILLGKYRSLESFQIDLPSRSVAVVHRALAPDPNDRWQSAAEVARELDRVLAEMHASIDEERLSSVVAEFCSDVVDAEIATELVLREMLARVRGGHSAGGDFDSCDPAGDHTEPLRPHEAWLGSSGGSARPSTARRSTG